MEKLRWIIKKYGHAIPLLIYGSIYMLWFGHLEDTVTKKYHIIHTPLDDYIPFCELFIIPYLLWFVYVAVVIAYLFFKDKDSYLKCCLFMAAGMTFFLIISTLFPNGHQLRPHVMPRDNIFTDLIANLYRTDTPTNIWPSIHVYNSIGAHLGIIKCPALRKHKGVCIGSLMLCISIILSTVMIKQHSVSDIFAALALAAITYFFVYAPHKKTSTGFQRKVRRKAA